VEETGAVKKTVAKTEEARARVTKILENIVKQVEGECGKRVYGC